MQALNQTPVSLVLYCSFFGLPPLIFILPPLHLLNKRFPLPPQTQKHSRNYQMAANSVKLYKMQQGPSYHTLVLIFVISPFSGIVHTGYPQRVQGVSAQSLCHHPWDNPAAPSLSLRERFGVFPKFIWVHKGCINYQVFCSRVLGFFILSLHKLIFSINKQGLIKHDCPERKISHFKLVWTSFQLIF